ncbi:MAG: thiol peroxidase [Bdellovibrionaceae bacterium]|nr:thiol peroxidase [Pseudobdellovibrionaceae bacterium]NUM58666.1 thiol peroxidase [Pseudobdellovibrionaceae bacterium]
MANITLKGNPVHTSGTLPEKATIAKDFKLVKSDLSEVSLQNYFGKKKVLNVFPSIDTGTCAASVRRFNQEAAQLHNTVVLNISADLPFAQTRFCGAEGIKNCETLSAFRSRFGQDYGIVILDSPLAGLLSRCVIVLSEDNQVLYTEQVSDIVNEPNYTAALLALK